MFKWVDDLAKARMMELKNEKITSAVRSARH